MLDLKILLADLPPVQIFGSEDLLISGISSNSKEIEKGFLFIAKKGGTFDGACFIPDALAKGAVAILSSNYHPLYPQITQLIHPEITRMEALLAKRFFHHADESLFLMGITGTNGKTTTSYLIKHLFDRLHVRCALIGTVESIIGTQRVPSSQTTLDVISNHKLFSQMRLSQDLACVMEVSSHALSQARVEGIAYDVAIFTNLTQDHLDYHGDMQSYALAKSKLFSSLSPLKTAVVNIDSPWHERMLFECSSSVLLYGIDNNCDLRAEDIAWTDRDTSMNISYRGKSYPFKSTLIGKFNVYNILAAIGSGLAKGFQIEEILLALAEFENVPGRMQKVPNTKDLCILIDYAHTPDALQNVLQTLKQVQKQGRLITVFGCGGDRDFHKRAPMGSIVESLSDVAIITSDNPRSEDPDRILSDTLKGFQNPSSAILICDRAEAIAHAIAIATP
ncbi:MAG: UDP-N-acetylmuramoyl-L-alanyl-D-glutamate--2,6-diaminopimelate ligase, partial [Chlamydiales bacterium]|nr:UDP-N-acetylmuramoyl-L-alanyl-D-glutamate--2,6-diaminopimelate ligase [Chlamydiales bacterium]